MKVERAVEALRRLSGLRRGLLRIELLSLRAEHKETAKSRRRAARKAKGDERVALVRAAQGREDAARDVGKLLALLDAIEAETKKPATTGEEKRR